MLVVGSIKSVVGLDSENENPVKKLSKNKFGLRRFKVITMWV